MASKSLINKHLIQSLRIENDQKYKGSSVSSIQLTQESGMYFNDVVLMDIVCDKKAQNTEVIQENVGYRLTTLAFGAIPVANIHKIKLYSHKIPNKVILKIEEDD